MDGRDSWSNGCGVLSLPHVFGGVLAVYARLFDIMAVSGPKVGCRWGGLRDLKVCRGLRAANNWHPTAK